MKKFFPAIGMRSVLRFFGAFILGLVLIALLVFNALLMWVASGPRSLDALSPYIAATLMPDDRSFEVTIGHTWLVWDGWEHPIDLRLREIEVHKAEQTLSRLPEISLRLSLSSLVKGRILPTSITLMHPSIRLVQRADKSISFDFSPTDAAKSPDGTLPASALLQEFASPDHASSLRKLRQVTVTSADIEVANAQKGTALQVGGADILLKRDRAGHVDFMTTGTLTYDGRQAGFNVALAMDKGSPRLSGTLGFTGLVPGPLAALFADERFISSLDFPLTGKIGLTLDISGRLMQAAFALDGQQGMIRLPMLQKPLALDSLRIEGTLGEAADDIRIDTLTASIDGHPLKASGHVVRHGEEDAEVQADLSLQGVPVDEVGTLWPPELSPMSRAWIVENITGGTVAQADLHLNIMQGDFSRPLLPKEAASATLRVEGAQVRYLPEHPPATTVTAVVKVDGESLSAAIESGEYLRDTKFSGGDMTIEDLNADNPYIKLNLAIDSTLRDTVRFLGLPRLGHAERLSLSEAKGQGAVHGKVQLGFFFFAPRDERGNVTAAADVDYVVDGSMENVSHPAFMKKFDLEKIGGTIHLDKKGLEFKGTGDVNGAAISSSDIRYLFTPGKDGLDTFINVQAEAPAEVLPRFGYPKLEFLSGTLKARAEIRQSDTKEYYDAAIDLKKASLDITDIGWSKPEGQPATIELKAEKLKSVITVPAFHLIAPDMDATGSAALNDDLSGFQHITLSRIVSGETDLTKLVYEPTVGGVKLQAEGKGADASHWLDRKDDEESQFSFEQFPAIDLKGDVGHVILGKKRTLDHFRGGISCDVQRCRSADIRAETEGGKPMRFTISTGEDGARRLSIQSKDAGALLRAFGVFKDMYGGEMMVSGRYDDAKGSMAGDLRISEHLVRDAPVLAKILAIASPTGMIDTLRGKGIRFEQMHAPFTVSKDVITLKDAGTHGPALGMTADGTITLPKQSLDIRGAIVPSYTLNGGLNKIPLIGTVLTGGEGEGIFAARYSIRGTTDAPDVSVNPLSVLTPGILRHFFDIFDSPAEKTDTSSRP